MIAFAEYTLNEYWILFQFPVLVNKACLKTISSLYVPHFANSTSNPVGASSHQLLSGTYNLLSELDD